MKLHGHLKWIWGAIFVASVTPLSSYAQDSKVASGGGTAPPKLPAEELDQLLAPIALYPDVLVAQILPASTFPIEIVKAARWLRANPKIDGLEEQTWDPSVLALCRYPTVLNMLDKDLDWTSAVGAAFLAQPQDIMSAIQRLRRSAGISGTLQTNEQQTIVFEQDMIRIVPTQSNVVYVPIYNPQVVYVEVQKDDGVSAGAAAAIGFGAGLALGSWLDTDCDWHHGNVYHCRPGCWGGWGHAGVVRYDHDWVAARGRHRGFVAGDHGGAYVGPRGAAVWGDHGRAAVWRRPTAYGAPRYTGRYASYNRRYGGNYGRVGNNNRQVNREPIVAGNEININRNNMRVDRGDRTSLRGGERSGDRVDNRVSSGARSRGLNQPHNSSAFGSTRRESETRRTSQRGQASRQNTGPASGSRAGRGELSQSGGSGYRAGRNRAQSGSRSSSSRRSSSNARSGSGHRSSFGDSRSNRQISRDSNRGSSSRRSSGGGRRGGGRRR